VAEVDDLALAEFTLGALDEELGFEQLGEGEPNMKMVLRLAAAVDEDVVKKKLAQTGEERVETPHL
jgi:hypothetical protein